MSDPSRPTSRWSTSMSIATKSTSSTNQTIPLMNIRKKLFRQSAHHQKNFAQRMAKSKQDMEDLFKLYYSNDIKFDTFQRQIVTGTRIPPTPRIPSIGQNNLTNSSTNVFNSKHCVSREQISTADINCTEKQEIHNETVTSSPISTAKDSMQNQIENNSTSNSPIQPNLSPLPIIPIIPNQSVISPLTNQDELIDSPFVKSVTFLEDIPNENINTEKNKLNTNQRPKSSLEAIQTSSPLSVINNNLRKDPTVLSHPSFTAITSIQQKPNPPAVVTGSSVIVQQRSPSKHSWNRSRTKSNLSVRTISSSSTTKTSTPSICSPLLIQPDMPELPVFIGAQRVVSIPSRCSRYVLVTFPEVPLRYNAPSYVERLLLPERFPNLFQNIVQSYDHHLTSNQHNRNSKSN